MATTIVIANQKGGVGKTTTAIELAAALANSGKRVLLIDLDQQRNLSKYVGVNPNSPTIYDALHVKAKIQDTIQHLEICDVIASSKELSKADREFVEAEDVFLLADLIDYVKSDYDYIVIDNNPSRNVLLTMAYIAAQAVIIPTESDSGSIEGILAINEDMLKLRSGRIPLCKAQIIGFILTKCEDTLQHSTAAELISELGAEIGDNPFFMTVRKAICVSECKQVGQSLQRYSRRSKPATDYRKIAEEIIRRTN